MPASVQSSYPSNEILEGAWRRKPVEAIRYGGVLFLFPLISYFTHPEPYYLRPLDPLPLTLGCYAILSVRESARESIRHPAAPKSIAVQEA